MTARIHPTALVDPDACIGDDVEIGPSAIVEACAIGDGCILGPSVTIKAGVDLGRGVRIEHGSMIGLPPADFMPDAIDGYTMAAPDARGPARVRVGHGAIIRAYSTIYGGDCYPAGSDSEPVRHRFTGRETRSDGATVIGAACHIMTNVIVGPGCQVGDRAVIVNATHLGAHVQVGASAVISGFVVVARNARIGRLAFVSGLSHVLADVPPFTMAYGSPACLYGLNKVGLQRAGLSTEVVRDIKRTYQLLFRDGLEVETAAARARDELPPAVLASVGELLDFIEADTANVATSRRQHQHRASK